MGDKSHEWKIYFFILIICFVHKVKHVRKLANVTKKREEAK